MSEQRDLMAGRYRLQHRIASGGMGHVWLAWDERLNRAVAIKQLRALDDLPEREAEVAHQRAMREARITARLEHPNAVPVFDVVDHEGQPCLVMKYIPSLSLHEILQTEGTMAPARVAKVGAEVASALAAAHAAEIVHRDVKPGNILITDDGTALITDFGISRAFGDVSLTSTGMLTGTPAYLAPEVARGGDSTPASDVFSLGSTLYAAVEGTPPFGAGDNPMALLHQVASGKIEPPRLAGALSGVLEAMLDPDPERRPTMQQVSEALGRLVAGGSPAPGDDRDRPSTTKVLPIVGGAAAAAGAAAALGTQGGHTVELPEDPPAPEKTPRQVAAAAAAPVPEQARVPDQGRVPAEARIPERARVPQEAKVPQQARVPEKRAGAGVAAAGAVAAGAGAVGLAHARGPAAGSAPASAPPAAPPSGPASVPASADGPGSGSAPPPAGPSPAALPRETPSERAGDLVDPNRRRRRRAAVLAGALVLMLLAIWGVQRAGDPAGEAAPRVTESSGAASSGATSGSPSPTSEQATSTAPSPTSSRSASAPTTKPAAPRATATAKPPAAPAATNAGSGAVTASDLSAALRGYYALLPQNTDAGWALLTDRYRRTTATSRDYYERFWGAISSVQVSDVSSKTPSSVVATIRYDYKDGRVYIERTSYSLVRDDGKLKIDRSTVLSSRQL